MKQTDIYTEALICLRSILQADHPEFKNWIDWLERDIQDWNQRREVAHHLRAYGGMGSFNDLPSMRGNHDYIFDFLKSVCYAFGHLYAKREGIDGGVPPRLEQAAYHPHKALNQAIAQHLMQTIYRRIWIGCRRTCYERKTISYPIQSNGNHREAGADGKLGYSL